MRLTGSVELKVAAHSDMMLVVRLTTVGVLARAGLTLDAMDNFKMAAEEACSCLIGQEQPPKALALKFSASETGLTLSVTGLDAESPTGSIDETELEVVRCILETMADEVSLDVTDGHIRSIELRVALA